MIYNERILVIDDDYQCGDFLEAYFSKRFDVDKARTAEQALRLIEEACRRNAPHDVVIADYDLDNGVTGLRLLQEAKRAYGNKTLCILMTGLIIHQKEFQQISKPFCPATLDQLLYMR